MSSAVEAYPLQWPVGWPRTERYRVKNGAYTVPFIRARDDVFRSVRLLGGRDVVLSTNIPLRRDGIPLAGQRQPDDVGVAVYWTDPKKKPRVIACDAWRKVDHNVRAVGLALEGLRSIDRAGASQILERAFTGFAALPAPMGGDWRQVLGFAPGTRPMRGQIEDAYRARVHTAHPDTGGSHDLMVALNDARAAALREIGG